MKKYIDNFRQYQFLLSELVKKGIKLKYRRSYLGIVWSMLEPLLSMIVLTIVFGTLYGNKDRTFPVYILTGRLLYSFYSQATKAALKSIRANSGMIKKVYVPKYLYPLSAVAYNFPDLPFGACNRKRDPWSEAYHLSASGSGAAAYYPAFLLWKRNASCNHRRIFPGY